MPLQCKVRSENPELVLFVVGYGSLKACHLPEFTDFFHKYLHGTEPFKVLYDLRGVKTPPICVVKELATYMMKYENVAAQMVIASSVVLDDIKIENALKLLFSFKEPITPTKITRSIEEACDFLNSY